MEAAAPLLSEPPQYRDPTWPGVFIEEGGGLPARWMSGANPDWRSNYAGLAERAERMAADRRKSSAERKDASELAGLLKRYLAFETPTIRESQAAREHLNEMDRVGEPMQALAVRLGLASASQPVYVTSATVKGRVLQERLTRQTGIVKAWASGAEQARRAGDDWSPTVKKAAAYIRKHHGCKTAAVAEHCDVETSSFRSHIAPALKKQDFSIGQGCAAVWNPPPK